MYFIIFYHIILVAERPETNLDQKYQAPINEVIINDPSCMSQSMVDQNISTSRHGDVLHHQSQQNSISGRMICN